ncbi:hypothetical protein Ae201684P_009650 [Aphanomyces euteiches]|nr:hypothetical protein Ae201684P_009650 [Aphanomyces euteiches]
MQTAIQQEVDDLKKALQQKTQDFDEAIEFFGKAIQDLRLRMSCYSHPQSRLPKIKSKPRCPVALNDADHRLSQDYMSKEEITAIESQATSSMTPKQVDNAVVDIAVADASMIRDEEYKASVENGSIAELKANSKMRWSLAKTKTSTAPQANKSVVSKAPPASKSGQRQDLLRVQTSKTRLETAQSSRSNATVDATTSSHSKNRLVVAEVAGIAKILPRQAPTCSPAKADIHETCHGASALTIHDPKPDNQQETKTTKRSAQTKTSHLEVTEKCLSSNLVVAIILAFSTISLDRWYNSVWLTHTGCLRVACLLQFRILGLLIASTDAVFQNAPLHCRHRKDPPTHDTYRHDNFYLCLERPHQLNRSENFVAVDPQDGNIQSQLQVQTKELRPSTQTTSGFTLEETVLDSSYRESSSIAGPTKPTRPS